MNQIPLGELILARIFFYHANGKRLCVVLLEFIDDTFANSRQRTETKIFSMCWIPYDKNKQLVAIDGKSYFSLLLKNLIL